MLVNIRSSAMCEPPGCAVELERLMIVAKGARGDGCRSLICNAINNTKVVVFGELLALPQFQSLRGTSNEPSLRLLEVFAYGTYKHFKEIRGQLPLAGDQTMEDRWVKKIRQLTLVRIARQHETVHYRQLFDELGMQEVRPLEDLIIDTMDAGLLQGRLNQRRQILRVRAAMGRDVQVEQISSMVDKLQNWVSNADSILAKFDSQMIELQQGRVAQEAERKSFKADFDRVRIDPKIGRLARVGGDCETFMNFESGFDDLIELGSAVAGDRKLSGGPRYKRNRMREPGGSRAARHK